MSPDLIRTFNNIATTTTTLSTAVLRKGKNETILNSNYGIRIVMLIAFYDRMCMIILHRLITHRSQIKIWARGWSVQVYSSSNTLEKIHEGFILCSRVFTMRGNGFKRASPCNLCLSRTTIHTVYTRFFRASTSIYNYDRTTISVCERAAVGWKKIKCLAGGISEMAIETKEKKKWHVFLVASYS